MVPGRSEGMPKLSTLEFARRVDFGTFGGTIKTTVCATIGCGSLSRDLDSNRSGGEHNKKKLDEKLRTALIQLPNRAPNGLTADANDHSRRSESLENVEKLSVVQACDFANQTIAIIRIAIANAGGF